MGCRPTSPGPGPDTGSPTTTAGETLKLLYWQAPIILTPHFSSGFKDSEASRITLEPLASSDAEGKMLLFLAAEEPTLTNGGVAAALLDQAGWVDSNGTRDKNGQEMTLVFQTSVHPLR